VAGHDYTYAERQRRRRQRLKASGLAEVRERVPPQFVHVLKSIAAEMRDPVKARKWERSSEQEGDQVERTIEGATNSPAHEVK
jgi:hypothetical protein